MDNNKKNTKIKSDENLADSNEFAIYDSWQKLGRYHPRRLVFWTLQKAGHPNSIWWLAGFCFIEAIFFPVPPDIMFIPMGVANKRKLLLYAFIAAIMTTLGGVVAWYIGTYAYQSIGLWIINTFEMADTASRLITKYNSNSFLIIIIGAFTPIPFKIIAITSGISSVPVLLFALYAFIGRLLRFLLLATILYFAANKIRWLLFRHFGLVSAFIFLIVVLGFYLVKFLYVL